MAKSNKERQAAYRMRRFTAGRSHLGDRRLNTWIGADASLSLARIALWEGISKRELLERLIAAEHKRILAGFEPGSPDMDAFFGLCIGGADE